MKLADDEDPTRSTETAELEQGLRDALDLYGGDDLSNHDVFLTAEYRALVADNDAC